MLTLPAVRLLLPVHHFNDTAISFNRVKLRMYLTTKYTLFLPQMLIPSVDI